MDFWHIKSEAAGTSNASELENSTFYQKNITRYINQIYKNTWETSVTFCLSKDFYPELIK